MNDSQTDVSKSALVVASIVGIVMFLIGYSAMEDPGVIGFLVAVAFAAFGFFLSLGASSLTQKAEMAADTVIQSGGRQQSSVADEIAKLASLRDSGAITDSEYEQQKAKLLDQ